jgi:type I restriction enzyme S subunit
MKNGATVEEKVGWTETELGQLCDVIRGASPRPMGDPKYFSGTIPFIKIGDITSVSGNTIFDSEIHVNEIGAKKSRFLKKGTLILSNSGTVCIPKFLGVDACIHDGFVAFNNIPNFVLQSFLFHYFHYIRPHVIQKHKQGITQVNLNTTIVKEFTIPIPPLPEQHAIVSKIEQLFSELDNGIANLKLAQEQLKVYRRAVLKKAFEGELTKKWRKQQADLPDAGELLAHIRKEREKAAKIAGKKLKPVKPFTEDELEYLKILPNEWNWVKIGDLTLGVEYGTSAKSKEFGDIAVLRMGNIQNGKFDWNDLVYTSDKADIKKYLLRKDDVLFNRTNSPELVGKTAIYKGEIPAIFAGYLIRINQFPRSAVADYLNYFLNCPLAKVYGNSIKTDGVNQSNINGEKLGNYPFPLCSLAEQQAIVQEIETRLSVCDKIEQDIETNLKKAEALRQSILKKAFDGKLLNEKELAEVRGAEDWEPTEVLLERIKAERARNGKK